MMVFDMNDVVKVLISLFAALMTCFIVPLIKSKTTSAQFTQIQLWVRIAVQAAEQLFKGSGRGQEKKQYVLEFLLGKGVKIDEDVLDALIESTVFDLPQYFDDTITENESVTEG